MREQHATERALTPAQAAAMAAVRARARSDRPDAIERIATALAPTSAAGSSTALLARVADFGRVTLNFHPDRLLADGGAVAAALLADGIYRNQFESGVSNGSVTAFAGGERDVWEERLFAGAYHSAALDGRERPKYGALNLFNWPDGGSVRFGSCYVRLRAEVLSRCTFCAGDSHVGPRDVGTIDAFEPVLAGMLETAGAPTVVQAVNALGPRPGDTSSRPLSRLLDGYVEAQVHGDIVLARDADGIVVDPSFRGTEIGAVLSAVAERNDLALEFHAGYSLPLVEVPDDFRGPEMPPLAARIHAAYGTDGQHVDAALLGRAAASVVTDPMSWADWAGPADTLQHIKYLWHVLVEFGGNASPNHPSVSDASPAH